MVFVATGIPHPLALSNTEQNLTAITTTSVNRTALREEQLARLEAQQQGQNAQQAGASAQQAAEQVLPAGAAGNAPAAATAAAAGAAPAGASAAPDAAVSFPAPIDATARRLLAGNSTAAPGREKWTKEKWTKEKYHNGGPHGSYKVCTRGVRRAHSRSLRGCVFICFTRRFGASMAAAVSIAHLTRLMMLPARLQQLSDLNWLLALVVLFIVVVGGAAMDVHSKPALLCFKALLGVAVRAKGRLHLS